VIFLSAKGQEAEVQTGLEAGAAEYILKPFSPDQLNKRISELLKKGQEI
jgi:two-component system alkaline phosphatase synthesis response regulator PhoP